MAGGKNRGGLTCPVCGMNVDQNTEFKEGHGGETYYFCSENDQKEFRKNPSQYLKKEKKAA